jgi:hypothetical protein
LLNLNTVKGRSSIQFLSAITRFTFPAIALLLEPQKRSPLAYHDRFLFPIVIALQNQRSL